jgi:hypothetical protein
MYIQDMAQVFKIFKKNIDKLPAARLFQPMDETARTRRGGNPWCVQRKLARTEVRLNSFGLRVAKKSNALQTKLQGFEKVAPFKNKLQEKAQYSIQSGIRTDVRPASSHGMDQGPATAEHQTRRMSIMRQSGAPWTTRQVSSTKF